MLTARKCVHKIYQMHLVDLAAEQYPVSEIRLFDLEKSFRGHGSDILTFILHPIEFHRLQLPPDNRPLTIAQQLTGRLLPGMGS